MIISNNFDGNGRNTHYNGWRQVRIKKLVSILGEDWFKGKKILEVACGWGHIGQSLAQKGAIITFTTCHEGDVPKIKEYNDTDANIFIIDHENKWKLDIEFDLVIHWGLLYHLDKWEQDLDIAISHTKEYLCLESEVSDSLDPHFEIKVEERWPNGSFHNLGTRPSPSNIERVLEKNGMKFTRYDDTDLNVAYHKYNWRHGTIPNSWGTGGYRRFWMAKKE